MAKDHELEAGDDLAYQRRDWRRERLAWAGMALIVVAAVLGLFGHGLLSTRTTSERPGFAVTYERVARQGGPTDLVVTIEGRPSSADLVQIRVSAGYLDDVDVEAITPEPSRSLLAGDGVIYEFDLHPDAHTGSTDIRFDLRPDHLGPTRGQLELIGHSTVHIEQFLLP